mmetsp:Transcript_2325/g.5406  ORF Transcript_2325/g.5406 Transcript_2325/m.5406 type:complete len:122 (-) Transcript_2325:423-788(-)
MIFGDLHLCKKRDGCLPLSPPLHESFGGFHVQGTHTPHPNPPNLQEFSLLLPLFFVFRICHFSIPPYRPHADTAVNFGEPKTREEEEEEVATYNHTVSGLFLVDSNDPVIFANLLLRGNKY